MKYVFTVDNIDILNDHPQKVGSDSEPSRGRLQVRSKGSARPFWEKEKQTNTPSFRWGIVSGACSDVVETSGLEPMTPCMSSKYSNQLSYASTY